MRVDCVTGGAGSGADILKAAGAAVANAIATTKNAVSRMVFACFRP